MIEEMLHRAHRVLDDPAVPGSIWPRAAAFLTRQALEEALDCLWAVYHPGMVDTSRRTQMLCLGQVIEDEALAADVRAAWSSLSRACHHHHYELAPTAAELEGWIQQTEHLLASLEPASAAPDG